MIRFLFTLLLVAVGLWLIRPSGLAVSRQPSAVSPENLTSTLVASSPLTLTPELMRKIHPQLLKQILATASDLQTADWRVIVMVKASPVSASPLSPAASLAEHRVAQVQSLQATAARSQAGVQSFLVAEQSAGRAAEVRSLWINNSLAARVSRSTLYALAARDDVALIQLDQYRHWVDPEFRIQNTEFRIRDQPSVQWNISQIHADQVWSALNISGTGVVVANMDTGVDWQHPALQAAYRGYNPKGLANHIFSWIDTTGLNTQYPYDGNGHGTHTLGTIVGSGGIGVAPGAQWIAARVLDSSGNGYDSWIHAGFQWIMAPGGDPTKAPDILSNSWGSTDGTDTTFRPDVIALNNAGIVTFFSNGNSGPGSATVGSPASYPESFGIGATDNFDSIAWFSSRGPSPLGPIKPDLSAPGVNILSSFPGGAYMTLSGTSMAAPHVAGVAALMRSAAPGLTITATRYALTSTAIHPTTDTYPNNVYGWGRVDALNAVLAVAHTGAITGMVTRSDMATPIVGATIHAASIDDIASDVTTGVSGTYGISLIPSIYTVTASAFGYASSTPINVMVLTGTVTRRDFILTPLPTGVVQGRLTDLTGTVSVTGTIAVQNTPVTVAVAGAYSIALPGGTYVLRVQSPAHRILTATVTIIAGQTVIQNFALPDAPNILLVDGGRWYNGSQISYYQNALDDLGYSYTSWPIADLNTDVPTSSTLKLYDTVIWSSPQDSPNYINAGSAISSYLGAGGHLLLSGQDVGYWDAQWTYSPYYSNQLLAQFVADNGPTRILTGSNNFAGQVVSISGAGGANNQASPDLIASLNPLLTSDAFDYAPGQSGGQTVGLCQPHRAVYLAYGFEAIADETAREDVISRTLAYFASPRSRFNYTLVPPLDPSIGPPGTSVTGAVTLYNFDELSSAAFNLSVDSLWAASISPTIATLNSCTQQSITVTVNLPPDLAPGTTQTVTIFAHSTVSPSLSLSSTLIFKAPGSVLIVDDDRWYPVNAPYRSSLAANGLSYDLWRVPTSWAGPEPAVPSINRLDWYPEVIWFTGYDWFQTLTNSDEQLLSQYLSNGGRLWLSSQGYMSQDGLTNFGSSALGVLAYSEDWIASAATGPSGSLFEGLIFEPLVFPYPNFSLALAPQPDAQIALIGDHARPIAVTHRYGDFGKTLFMAFGFEGLPLAAQPEVMNRSVGYLSWLGSSSVKFDRTVASPGEPVTATLIAVDDGPARINQAAFTATLPSGLTYTGGDPLTWSGSLMPGQSVTHTIAMILDPSLSAGSQVTLPLTLCDVDHALCFTTTARLSIDAPTFALDLSPSRTLIHPRDAVTWTLTARNLGVDAPTTEINASLPFSQTLISGTLSASVGGANELSGTISWAGSISAGQVVTLTYQATGTLVLSDTLYYGGAVISDGMDVWQTGSWLAVQPYKAYLPVVRKKS